MRITVDVKTRAKKDSVELVSRGHYLVRTRAPPSKGKANVAVMKILEDYLDKRVELVFGHRSSRKIFLVEE